MRVALRFLGWAALALVALIALALVVLHRADIPYAILEAKYGGPASRYIDMPGGLRVHYRDQGRPDGPPLVMVHGFSASLDAWDPWVARLKGDYHIVTLDLPGHGLTRAPTGYAASIDGYTDIVDALADRLKLGRYVVIGNSMGGAVAWDDALRHGDHLRGLVLVDAAGWPAKGATQNSALIFSILKNPVGRALIRDLDTRALAKQGLEKAYFDRRLVTPALVDRYVELSRAPGHRDILMTIQTQAHEPVTAATFARIRAPTLVMHGRQDALIPVADGEGLAGAIPGAKLILYDQVGHVPMEQIPDRSAADLRAFLSSIPPQP